MSKFKEHLPWLSPDDSVECIELLEETALLLEKFGAFGSMRRELRLQLTEQARKVREFQGRVNQPVIERSIFLAIEELALKWQVRTRAALQTIIESYISKINKAG